MSCQSAPVLQDHAAPDTCVSLATYIGNSELPPSTLTAD
ncbi:unnamed protein product, partial [Staurois parvus]